MYLKKDWGVYSIKGFKLVEEKEKVFIIFNLDGYDEIVKYEIKNEEEIIAQSFDAIVRLFNFYPAIVITESNITELLKKAEAFVLDEEDNDIEDSIKNLV